MRGYSYDRRDVTGRGLANAYAQTLGTIFSSGGEKPYEVEIFVAEVGDAGRGRPDLPADLRRLGRRRARLRRDGRRGRAVGGVPRGALPATGASLEDALRLAVAGAGPDRRRDGRPRPGDPDEHLEVAVLDRTRAQPRKFRRLTGGRLDALLGDRGPGDAEPAASAPRRHRTTPPTRPPVSGDPAAREPDDPSRPRPTGQRRRRPPLEDPVAGDPAAPSGSRPPTATAPELARRPSATSPTRDRRPAPPRDRQPGGFATRSEAGRRRVGRPARAGDSVRASPTTRACPS